MVWQIVVAGRGDEAQKDVVAPYLRGFLTSVSKAHDGDVVVIGLPLAAHGDDAICFDVDHPFPEIVVMREGRLCLAMDRDVDADCRAAVMRIMASLKESPMEACLGVSAVRKYLDVARAKEGHRGFMAWYYRDFVSATSWSEDLQLKVAVFDGCDRDVKRKAELMSEMDEIAKRSSISRCMMRTLRR